MAAFLRSPLFRLPVALAALVAAAAGQWWLSVQYTPTYSAYAWALAAGLFILLMLDSESRRLPAPEPPLAPAIEWSAFAAVMLLGLVFRTYRLDLIPSGLNHDVAWNGLYAIRILNGEPYTPYVGEAAGRETLMFYLQALGIKWFGPEVFALIIPAIVAGSALLPVLYCWVRELFGPRLALGATFFLAVSGWHVVFSRIGWRAVLQPLISTVAYLFFARGLNRASLLSFGLAGASVAAALYTYNAARTLPALFVLYALYRVIVAHDREALMRRWWPAGVCMAAAFVVVILPMAHYAVNNWDVWQSRASETYFWSGSNLWSNLKETVLLYPLWGNGEDFFTETPLLEYPAAVLLGFGVVWCLVRPSDHRVMFLLLGVLASVIPGAVSRPNANRDIGSLPFIYVFVALGGAFFVRELKALRMREPLAVAIAVTALAASYATYAQYFGPQRRLVFGFYPETTVLGRYLKTLVPRYDIWVGGANFPLNTLLYLSYPGSGDPMQCQFTWVDDIAQLPSMELPSTPGRGLAFVIAAHAGGADVFDEMKQRFPAHSIVELRDPGENDRVFARALLIAPDAGPGGPPAAPRRGLWTAQEGKGPGQFDDLKGIAVGSNGELFVADTGNHRVQKFRPDGSWVATWGGQGDKPGELNEPNALAVDGTGNLHVVDTWNNRVQKLTPDGVVLTTYAPPDEFFGPRGIAIMKDRVYVTDGGHGTVAIFTVDGVFESAFGSLGSGPGQLSLPIGIAVTPDGTIWVVDSGNNRLQAFDAGGQSIRTVPVPGWSGTDVKEAYLASAPDGTVIMTEPISGELLQIGSDDKLRSIGFGFIAPTGITVDATRWYVTQRRPARVVTLRRAPRPL